VASDPEASAAPPELLRHHTRDELAAAVAARLVTTLVDVQSSGRVPSIVLTGGTVAADIHAAVAGSPARGAVDWRAVDFWFGDERFVPADSPDRNAGQATEAMLGRLPVDAARVHAMPASDGVPGADVEAAASAHAEDLRRALPVDDPGAALFDVLMLGVGEDGHCASLFPGHAALDASGLVVAVRDSPKPPPTRISLTLPALARAREVWFVAAGAEKAEAVELAWSGADLRRTPAVGPRGSARTLWLVDVAAASRLPRRVD
jgi:6-phosphogluconolactonase